MNLNSEYTYDILEIVLELEFMMEGKHAKNENYLYDWTGM